MLWSASWTITSWASAVASCRRARSHHCAPAGIYVESITPGDSSSALVQIADNGIGIAEEHRGRVFLFRSIKTGGRSYITRRVTLEGLVEGMHGQGNYWFEIVRLPSDAS